MVDSPHTPIEPSGIYAPATYAHAMRAGDTLYVAGQVARDADGALVAPGDAAAQADVVFANLGAVLAAAGVRPEHVVKVTTYLADPEDGAVVARARQGFFGSHRPPHTGLIVGLGAGVRVEVEVVAVFP
jgi:2-iminobutanoate/2-iminopropanoate deaminase